MKRIVILGAGTGGTILANKLVRSLPDGWSVAVIDSGDVHLYQPGLVFVPFEHDEARIVRPRRSTLRGGIAWIHAEVSGIDPVKRTLGLLPGGELAWDLLVIASGARVRPDLVPGLVGEDARQDAFDLYTLGGAQALRHRLERFREGRFVVSVADGPIKAETAPLETLFLADELFRRRGDRHRIELVLATPNAQVTPATLQHLLEQKQIVVESSFGTCTLDRDGKRMIAPNGRAIPYDVLGVVPPHTGAACVERAGIGDERAFVRTHRATLEARELPNVFVLGDATDLPIPKLGSVAHYEAELLADNLVRLVHGLELRPTFDGHSSAFIETGGGKAVLLDRDYGHAPSPGRMGWFPLLEQSRLAHFGKRAFRWVYWNVVLPGRPLPARTRHASAGAPLF